VPLKITTLNVNGLRSAERRGFRRWLSRARPDVLCLQEIRCQEEAAPRNLWRPRGWQVAWHPAEKKGYAGTAVWTRAEARFTVGNGHPRGDTEGRAVCAHLPELDVWSFYMPSGSSGPERQAWKLEFMAHAWDWLGALRTTGRPTLVCGDINIAHRPIDLKNWRSNQKNSGFLPEERAWMDRLLASGWRDVFRERHPDRVAYSWWSNRGRARENDVGWRIDYVLASPGITILDCAIDREAGLSDHAPVSAWIEVPGAASEQPAPPTARRRKRPRNAEAALGS
jgi:exodeoxyribonuclease-3